MNIKLKNMYGTNNMGDVVDAAVAKNGNAYFFDANSTAWYLMPHDFDLVLEELEKKKTSGGLPEIFGQELESMNVTFK